MRVQFPVTSEKTVVLMQHGVENLKFEASVSRRNGIKVYGFYRGDAKKFEEAVVVYRIEEPLGIGSDKTAVLFSLILPEKENEEFPDGYRHKEMGKTNEEMKEVIKDYNARNGIVDKPEVKHKKEVQEATAVVPDINAILEAQRGKSETPKE
jgi:hypothetical protein